MNRIFTFRFLLVSALIALPLTVNCQDIAINILKSRVLTAEGKTDSAILVLDNVIAGFEDAGLYVERAGAKLSVNDIAGAISDYTKANELSAGAGEYGLAKAYALKGDVNTALYHLERNMDSDYKAKEKELMLDPAFGTVSKSSEWKSFIKKEWYSNVETSLSEVEYYLKSGKTGEAMEIIRVLLCDYPEDHGVQYSSALFDYSIGDYNKSVNTLSKLVTEEPENIAYRELLAKSKQSGGNYAGASSIYSELLVENVPEPDLFLGQALCLYKLGEYPKAESAINSFLLVYPNDKEALSLAATIKTAAGDYIEAIKIYSRQIEKNQDDPKCFIDRGDVYFMAKSWSLAANDYGMALDLDPNNALCWLNKGISLINLKQEDEGCFCLKMAFNKGETKAGTLVSKYCE